MNQRYRCLPKYELDGSPISTIRECTRLMQLDPSDIEGWPAEWKRIWPTSCEIKRWLHGVFHPPWPHDIRRDLDDDRHTIWSIPDYENGRSRSLAVERDVLRDSDSRTIIDALEDAGWERRVEKEDLLVRKAHDALEVATWDAPRFVKWFRSPDHEEWFVAFQSHSGGVSWGEPPPPIRYFVAIHGKSHAAVGPEGEHDIAMLDFEAIKRHLPKPHVGS